MNPTGRARALTTALVTFAAACAPSSDQDQGGASTALIAGFDVRDPRADAVGSLGRIFGADTFDPSCTGTLIAPDKVLTAKHCVMASPVEAPYVDDRAIGFAIGFDADHPRRLVRVRSVQVNEPHQGGFIGFGHDVAVYTLEQPVTDVAPLGVTRKPLAQSDVGARFWAAGYGAQDYERRVRGTRRGGAVTLRAVAGAPMQALFADRESFFSFLRATEGDGWVTEKRPTLEAFFHYVLLSGREVHVGLGEAQPCDGDSGGPLVRQIGQDFEIVGVVSGSRKGAGGRCSVLGEFYASVDRASLGL